MCGIVGIFSHQPVAAEIYTSLISLQHRGQDSAGILTYDERFYQKHGLGLVQEIFGRDAVSELRGNIGIGHTRYATAGGYNLADAQPLWIGSPRGIGLAHNGNLLNYAELAAEITQRQHRHLSSTIDSEVLLHLLADGFNQQGHFTQDENAFFHMICQAVKNIFARAEGSYSVVSTIIGKGLLAFRDPHGIRPLVLGIRVNAQGKKDYIFASETTMFYALGFQLLGDVAPGEVVYINQAGELFRQVLMQKSYAPCIFEYVYFARPDAIINEIEVYRARQLMGTILARRWKEKYPDLLPDVVIAAPFTSNTAALAFANEINVHYAEGLYKNTFIGRTFIMPNGEKRGSNVRHKLTPQKSEIANKAVLILDDSIVRGTTSREIIRMLRESGAKKIYFVSASPPIVNPCFYGIDLPFRKDLIAADSTIEQVGQYLGADKILYQALNDLMDAVMQDKLLKFEKPCMACMDGCYITGNPSKEKICQLENERLGNKVSA